MHDADVQRIADVRNWPRSVADYAAMMDESAAAPVRFTSKGDRAVVQYNFFKMCIGLRLRTSARNSRASENRPPAELPEAASDASTVAAESEVQTVLFEQEGALGFTFVGHPSTVACHCSLCCICAHSATCVLR